MRKILTVLPLLLTLPMLCFTILGADDVRQVFPETAIVGDEVREAVGVNGAEMEVPSPPRIFQVGTIVDSTIYDHQSNATLHQRIATVGDSALHATTMYSPVSDFTERGMKYYYYDGTAFTDLGYIEGSGTGDEHGGYGSVVSYYVPSLEIGNIAVMTSHTNLDSRAYGSHWYSFYDANQGQGSFTPTEGPPGSGSDLCDRLLWPSLYITNDETGDMAMVGFTFDQSCEGGIDDILVTHKTFGDTMWGDPVLLHTLDYANAWKSFPNIPMLAGADNGLMCIASADMGTNVYLWYSTDAGVTWSNRVNVSGYPVTPIICPPDSTSTEYRPMQNNAIAVSPGGMPHVVWTEYQARGSAIDSLYTPGVSGLYQYRTKLTHWDPVHGVTTVYRHPAGLADFAEGTAFAYNVGHPTIGFGETDDIVFVVYEGFVDEDQDPTNGIYFGDIYVSMSTDGGATWEDRVNITDSPGSDDLYPAIARKNPQGVVQELDGFSVGDPDGVNDFVIMYQNDDVAGTFLRGEEPVANWDMVLVAPVDLAALGPELEIDIEPVNGQVFDPGDWIIYAVTLTNNSTSAIEVTAAAYASNVADWRLNLFGPITFTIPGESTIGPVNLQNQVPWGAPPMTAYICAEANEVHDCYQVTIQ
ncbi:MAG: hypothetical protein ACE5OP_02010 [Candidatus Glassbacteria bacterium]